MVHFGVFYVAPVVRADKSLDIFRFLRVPGYVPAAIATVQTPQDRFCCQVPDGENGGFNGGSQ